VELNGANTCQFTNKVLFVIGLSVSTGSRVESSSSSSLLEMQDGICPSYSSTLLLEQNEKGSWPMITIQSLWYIIIVIIRCMIRLPGSYVTTSLTNWIWHNDKNWTHFTQYLLVSWIRPKTSDKNVKNLITQPINIEIKESIFISDHNLC